MDSLTDFALREKYAQVKRFRSRLEEMKQLLDWDAFVSLIPQRVSGPGRPPYDTVLKLRLLFLQSWFSLSDEELEFQCHDRLSFQAFLDFPKQVPDFSTVWRFRDLLAEHDVTDRVWGELQRQLTKKHLTVEQGHIQDARFVKAQPGKQSSDQVRRGREAKTSRSRDGTWTKKNGQSHFGYKLHTKVGYKTKLIKEFGVTTAKTHDSRIDLGAPGEVLYRDKAWTATPTKATGNGSMKRGKRSAKDYLRNKRIAKKRCRGEHPFGTMQRSFHAGTTKLTTLTRVFVQQLFVCAAYNLSRLHYLVRT